MHATCMTLVPHSLPTTAEAGLSHPHAATPAAFADNTARWDFPCARTSCCCDRQKETNHGLQSTAEK